MTIAAVLSTRAEVATISQGATLGRPRPSFTRHRSGLWWCRAGEVAGVSERDIVACLAAHGDATGGGGRRCMTPGDHVLLAPRPDGAGADDGARIRHLPCCRRTAGRDRLDRGPVKIASTNRARSRGDAGLHPVA
jgi:hypothetical protein